jgi:endonuclease/exonuclease/phosphatase family metal-dependent hydrolase
VIVGDFHAAPDEVGVPAPWVDAWSRTDEPGPTVGQAADLANQGSSLRERIDYVFVRDAVVVASRRIGHLADDKSRPHGLWPSDHAGVVADLEL